MSMTPSSFKVERDDPFDTSRIAENLSVFGTNRVNVVVPATDL